MARGRRFFIDFDGEEEMTPSRIFLRKDRQLRQLVRDCRYVGDCFTEIVTVVSHVPFIASLPIAFVTLHIIDRENNFNFTYIHETKRKYRFVFVSFGLQTQRNFANFGYFVIYILNSSLRENRPSTRTTRTGALLIERLVLIFWCDKGELDVMEGRLKGWFDEAV